MQLLWLLPDGLAIRLASAQWLFDWLRRPQLKNRAALAGGDSGINSYIQDTATYLSIGAANAFETAAVEDALGLIGRAFMAAEPTPAIPALDANTLSMMARNLVATGNALFRIALNRRFELVLEPITVERIEGGFREDSWTYIFKQIRPNGEEVETAIPGAGIVHVRYMPSPGAPWAGVSPLARAGLSAETLAYIERSLKYDASQPGGGILPMPDGASPSTVSQARAALTTGKGGITY